MSSTGAVGAALKIALPPIAVVDGLPAEQLPAVALHLAALQAAIASRWVQETHVPPASPADELLGVETAGRLAHRSASWIRHHGHTLPGFHQPGGRGTRVGWWRRSLETWAQAPLARSPSE